MTTASGIKSLLQALASGRPLTADEAAHAVDVLTNEATPAQMGAFLMGLRVRGETVDEITGAARTLRAKMMPVTVAPGAIDIVGTGGDGHCTFNVSTGAAIVAAGAGLKVAKHGNRSVSSLSGASDVLSALGVKLDCGTDAIVRAVDDAGVGFLWAPAHHPAMKAWAAARGDLGIRTLFNLLGPICNPAGVKHHVLGVFAPEWVQPIAAVLRALGSERAWVVHGHDGLDELSTTGPTTVAELKDGAITTFEVTPEDAGLPRATLADLKGGDGAHNAEALRSLLAGDPGPYRDIVVFNTAAALIVAGRAASLAEGAALAADAIQSGRAARALERLVAISNNAG
ncbi:anthranilate phosphoribosyltransferase [Hyphomicrobium nitrativorans NL23]|uniref:Anthranilate phosphoribosyltransferase n=1 Tax=Hyphomicrobium nitrativorans NL23 TaxID=1029756 RepID=V5SFN5_9HYPH|nr:anthranilate phosphoribosyltransferase [Hyphomicrobium nitrativorans]AHB48835.1 anthranilate phosphoribosyltransferase [Hyphomicrobium nitrativorans NL23]